MQKLILLLFFITASFCAKVDIRLYEGENVQQYLLDIEKEINSEIVQKLKTSQTISYEKSTLEKIKRLYEIKDETKSFETITLQKSSITQTQYLKALYSLGELESEIDRLENKNITIQKKLFELKTTIEKTLPQDANKTLLANQLQYAFYKISQNKITKSLKLYEEIFNKEFKIFQHFLLRVNFKEQNSKKIIKQEEIKIGDLNRENLLLNIDKDSEALRNKKAQKQIIKDEKKLQKRTDDTFTKKLDAQILLSLKWIKEKNQNEFLKSLQMIEDDIKTLSDLEKEKFNTISKLLNKMGYAKFDMFEVALASTQVGVENLINYILHSINKTIFIYEENAFSIKTILTFIVILIIGSILALLYKKFIEKFRKSNRIKSLSTARMVANSGYYIIILATFFIALISIGLNIHTIFIIIGAILLWIILGLQGFISNYAMGILIKIDRSIRIGDHIEINDKITGVVDDMDFRSITILTSNHMRITVPNSKFINDSFINHSLENQIRRIEVPFSAKDVVEYELIQKTILCALNLSTIPHIRSLEKKAQIIITDIDATVTKYSLLIWINQHKKYDIRVIKSPFLVLIDQSLKGIKAF